jgi:hypothetical protein
MRKLKLSLKKDIISDLEGKEIKGGNGSKFDCTPRTAVSICIRCVYTKGEEYTCEMVCGLE